MTTKAGDRYNRYKDSLNYSNLYFVYIYIFFHKKFFKKHKPLY